MPVAELMSVGPLCRKWAIHHLNELMDGPLEPELQEWA